MVQMIPMVVGDKEVVYLRKIVRGVAVGAPESFGSKRKWRGGPGKNRVDQDSFAIHLKKIGGMPKPDQHRCVGIQV